MRDSGNPLGLIQSLTELPMEQEVAQGSCEVFPFTLGTRKILIKVNEEML